MSLGPLMIDIAGTELTAEDIKVLSHPLVGSVILFTRNYRDIAQLTALTAAIRAVRSPQLLIAVDHEGGRVQRFREGFTQLPPARLLGRRYDQDRREGLSLAHAVGWLMASELRIVGVDFSFAPCVDLDYGVSEIIGDRSFHKDPDVVAALGVAVMSGMREAGMAAVAKHFPGHGAVIADSHVALPVDRRKFVDLEADIRPYRPLIDNNLAGVMGAHVVFPRSTRCPPACRSVGSPGCCATSSSSTVVCSRMIYRWRVPLLLGESLNASGMHLQQVATSCPFVTIDKRYSPCWNISGPRPEQRLPRRGWSACGLGESPQRIFIRIASGSRR